MRLKGKTVLVTAAGQGIGKASALAMAAERAKVWATDVNAQLLTSCAGVSNIHTASLEVLDKSAIQKLIADMPVIDVLFNCAGSVHVGTALDALDEEWDFAFDLNLRSQCLTIQSALPRMIASGHGNIINMASVASVKGVHNRFVYSATKAAFIGLTKSVAADFVGQGIRCNAICPGTVDTPSLGDWISAYDDPAAARKSFIACRPMGWLAQACEISPLVVFLASDESAFVTGQTYGIDGGMTI